MKLFTQLALVSAIAASGSAFAMQSMNDQDMSSTTGQDGITILIAPGAGDIASSPLLPGMVGQITVDTAILHDKDGVGAGSEAGAIVIGKANDGSTIPLAIQASGPIEVNIDASGSGTAAGTGSTGHVALGGAPFLNINVVLPSSLNIITGDIAVAGSARGGLAVGDSAVADAATGGTVGTAVKILNSMTIGLNSTTLNIQLGNTPQGAMIVLGGNVTGGLSIANGGITDATAGAGGTLGTGDLLLTNGAAATGVAGNLTLAASIDVVSAANLTAALGTPAPGGLSLTLGTAGVADSAKYNVMLENVTLGGPSSTLGDLELQGVNLTGTRVVIMGH
jgi:hypothetical protein